MATPALPLPNIRRFFVPDPGYIIADCDLAGAEAQVVAWEAGDEDLKAAFRAGLNVHIKNARDVYPEKVRGWSDTAIHSTDSPGGIYYTCKRCVHACVVAEHEALTPFGWKQVSELVDGGLIFVCGSKGDAGHFEAVSWHKLHTTTTMVKLSGQQYSQLVTWDHTIPTRDGAQRALDLPKSARLLRTTSCTASANFDPQFCRLLAAFHADGSISRRQVRFHLKKPRKVLRLLHILDALGQTPDVRRYKDGTCNVVVHGDLASSLRDWGKPITWELLGLGEHLSAYVDELPFWDGYVGPSRTTIYNKSREVIEILQTLQALCGYSGNISKGTRCWRVHRSSRRYSRMEAKESLPWSGTVYCPITTTGFWLTRYEGYISVTGNTHNGGKPRGLARQIPGVTVAEAEEFQRNWFGLHPAIEARQDYVMACLEGRIEGNPPRTIYNKFGYRIVYFDRIDSLLPQALTWVQQSTVAILSILGPLQLTGFSTIDKTVADRFIKKFALSRDLHVPWVNYLLQVHDSIVIQYPIAKSRNTGDIQKALSVAVPYDEPLVIPWGLKTSRKSWGDVEATPW